MLNVGCYVVMSSAMYESNSTRERSEILSFRSRLCGLCCSSRGANSERFPCESGRSMENGRKRELEKLTMAIREIKKKLSESNVIISRFVYVSTKLFFVISTCLNAQQNA